MKLKEASVALQSFDLFIQDISDGKLVFETGV
jgi:hypothetical protein